MNKFNEDVAIPKEYLNISNLGIYDTVNKRHGIIIGIKLQFSFLYGYYFEIEGYFDRVNDSKIICKEDFIKDKIKFVMITDYKSLLLTPEEQKDLENKQLNSIKAFLGEAYTDDCVLWISQDKRKAEKAEQEYREKEKIGKEIKWAESATKDFVLENFSALEIFELYENEVITEHQFLVELINILAAENRTIRNEKGLKDTKEFEKTIKDFLKNNKEIISTMIKNATAESTSEGKQDEQIEN